MATPFEAGMALRLPLRAVSGAGLLLYRGLAGGWTRAENALIRMHARSRQRMHLSELDAHLLKDIGLTQDSADKELRRPFWMK